MSRHNVSSSLFFFSPQGRTVVVVVVAAAFVPFSPAAFPAMDRVESQYHSARNGWERQRGGGGAGRIKSGREVIIGAFPTT